VASQRTPIRCAIYTGQSVETHHDLSWCQVQFDLCRAHVNSQRSLGYVPVDERFDDEGHSGTTLRRPALSRLLDAIRQGRIDCVVVYRLDRLSRRLLHTTSLLNTLRERNVKLDVVTSPELGSTAFDTFLLNMLASFSEFERELTASRIAEARARLKAHGLRVAGAVPFGYQADPRTKQLVVDEAEGECVTQFFEWAESGLAPSKIAGEANARGWTTKSGNPWTARQILATLKNHVYIGLISFGKGVGLGCHESLVKRTTFEAVQTIIANRRTGRSSGRNKPLHLEWILRGVLRCGTCGRMMSSHSVQVGPCMHLYYRCRSTAGGQAHCKGVMVSAHKIETLVLSKINVSWRLATQERARRVRDSVREVVYEATTGKVRISLLRPLDELARDGAEATVRREAEVPHRSAPRRR
jgi:site-specific DNA recombinase